MTPEMEKREENENQVQAAPAKKKKKSNGGYSVAQCFLRALAAMATLSAALLMGFDEQSNTVAGFVMRANYKSSPAFKWFLYGNAAASGFSLLSLPLTFFFGNSYALHLLDMLAMGLVMGSATGAAAIGYVGKYGNDHIGWIKVCPYYEKFCNQATHSLVCSYAGFMLIFLVSCLSSPPKST